MTENVQSTDDGGRPSIQPNAFLGWLAAEAAGRDAAGLTRRLRIREAAGDGVLDLAGNDYLGLSGDPRLVEAAVAAAREWGAGAGASRLVTGTTRLHATLEEEAAAFCGQPAGLVFSSGYLANLAVLAGLSEPGDVIFSDERNHASLIDGCRLSRARVIVLPQPSRAIPAAKASRTRGSLARLR